MGGRMMGRYVMRKLVRSLALSSAVVVVGACGGTTVGVPVSELQPVPISRVQPGDVVYIEFWQQEELSGERIVDRSGYIHLPLLRSVQVGGLDADQIREKLTTLYQKYYAEPLVVVNVLLGVSVTGEVRQPGRYTVDPAFNVLDLLGQAGGLLFEAKRDKIELNRGGQRYIVNLDEAQLSDNPDKLRLQSGDWIYVPRRFMTLQRTLTYATVAVLTLTIASFFR